MSCHLRFIATLRKIHGRRVPHQSSFWQSQGTTLSCKINTDVAHSGNWRRGAGASGAGLCKETASYTPCGSLPCRRQPRFKRPASSILKKRLSCLELGTRRTSPLGLQEGRAHTRCEGAGLRGFEPKRTQLHMHLKQCLCRQ